MLAPAISLFEPKPLLRIMRPPKRLLLGLFGILVALATWQSGSEALQMLALASVVAMVADFALSAVRSERVGFPDGALLTGMIIGFVLSPVTAAPVVIAAVLAAIVSKHVIRTRWSNVLNPAAVALVVSGYLLGTGQSWWGALPDWGVAGVVVIAAMGIYVANYVNKLPMVLVFLAAYFGLCTIASFFGLSGDVAAIYRAPDVNGVLFFAFFMLDDPPTSPVKYEDQVVYGLIVAAMAYLVLLQIGAVYYLPLALLAGNAWESLRRLGIDFHRKRLRALRSQDSSDGRGP